MRQASDQASALSFESFYDARYREALQLATLLVRDSGHAAELVQEVFAAAFARWPTVGRYDRPDLWLRRLVINRAISRRRRLGSELKAMARVGGGRATHASEDSPSRGVGVWLHVRRLPRRQAEALVLVYGCDLSLDDAAVIMRCTTGSVKTHLSRGRAAMATRWEEEES